MRNGAAPLADTAVTWPGSKEKTPALARSQSSPRAGSVNRLVPLGAASLFTKELPTRGARPHAALAVLLVFALAHAQGVCAEAIVSDVTQLNPIHVAQIVAPTSIAEITAVVKNYSGAIAIGGGRYSMGGQNGHHRWPAD